MGRPKLGKLDRLRNDSVYRIIYRLFPTVLLAAFTLSGCVSSPGNLVPSSTSLSFGSVAIGSSSTQSLTLTNSATGPITITQTVASGGGFTVKAPPLPLTLAEGQSATFTTRFAPKAIGSASGSLLITKSQTITTTPQLSGGSGSVTTSITTNQETIALTGAGASVTPSITTQPASQTVTAGQTATFLAAASGAAPLSYQWQKNGTAISGATSSTYITPAAATSDTGSQFTVVVSNSAGNAISNAATLTVTASAVAPSITTQPASQTVTAGQTATFSVAASGTAPLSYQWRKNGTAISGATSSTYTTPVATTSDTGSQFTVVVSNSAGNATSNAATLTVNSTPVAITVTPGSATVAAGSTQQFAGNVTGTSQTGVTWSVSGSGCTGAACGTISSTGIFVAPASVPSPAAVNVKATSVADPTKSASASVTIVAAVAVLLSISPTSASVPTVGTQLFTASVTGTSNTAVTWGLSGTGCSGSSCGTISTSAMSAVYSAPSVAPLPASVKVTVTSVADPTKSAISKRDCRSRGCCHGQSRKRLDIFRGIATVQRIRNGEFKHCRDMERLGNGMQRRGLRNDQQRRTLYGPGVGSIPSYGHHYGNQRSGLDEIERRQFDDPFVRKSRPRPANTSAGYRGRHHAGPNRDRPKHFGR